MTLTQSQLELSKSISYFLRHNPADLGTVLDIEGWVSFDEFLPKLSAKFAQEITAQDIVEILENSDKKRWEIDLENNAIRAIYGHSLDTVSIDYQAIDTPIALFHGTPKVNLESIMQKGLVSMSRQFVHLTPDKELALKTAKRISNDVILLKINTQQMLADSVPIYKASEFVYLVKSVEAQIYTVLKF